jgi:hypothetical protein
MNSSELIQGQIEALMPSYLRAKEEADKANATLTSIKNQMMKIIGKPQTVNTTWGKVIRKKGSRTVTVKDEALKAKIIKMKEDAIKTGKAKETIGSDSLNFYLT